jgi:hypothetical protein
MTDEQILACEAILTGWELKWEDRGEVQTTGEPQWQYYGEVVLNDYVLRQKGLGYRRRATPWRIPRATAMSPK